MVAELYKVGLVLLVAGGDEAVDLSDMGSAYGMGEEEGRKGWKRYLALDLDFFVVAVGDVPFC